MKKIILALMCACALTLGAAISSRAENTGVYIAPKFMMMWQNSYSDLTRTINGGRLHDESMANSQFTLGGALAVGYDFWEQHRVPIRAEIEFALRGNNEYSDDYIDRRNLGGVREEFKFLYNASTLLANFYWDFHNSSDFTPYVSAGAGLAFIHSEYTHTYHPTVFTRGGSTSVSDDFTNFAWNVGAGIAYKINDNVSVDLGYRYLNLGNVSMSGSLRNAPFAGVTTSHDCDSYASNHEIMLGARFTF